VNPGAVFAANSVSGDISAFTSASSTGVFSAAANSPFAGIPGNSFATADQRGSIFFTGSATGTQVAAFSVNQSTGALTGLTGSPLTVTGTDLGSAVYIAPTDSFAYTLDVTTGSLVENALNGTTISGPGTSTTAFTGANNIAADPQGDIIYALGLNATNGIQPFVISPMDGSLTQSTQSPALPGNWTSGSVDASGQFFVAVDSAAKTLKSFSITPVGTGSGSDGILAPLAAGSVSLTGAGPWVVALDPQDRVVFVADQTAGTITIYAFTASTGALGTAGTVTNVSTNGLTQISTDATGTYLYAGVRAAVGPGSAGAIAVYKIGVAGALAAVAGSPFGTGTGNPGIAATNVVQ
jgi:6-phosphogluconolactonase (cycloisomerase 2 family)